jgi:carbamoyltransferase
MNILGLQFSHDASASVIEDNNIVFYQEEQMFSGIKRDNNISYLWNEFKNKHFDVIVFTHSKIIKEEIDIYKKYIINQCKNNNITFDKIEVDYDHHLQHAACAFFNSNYKDAYCLIIDGSGTDYYYNNESIGYEIESIYQFKDNKINLVFKICQGNDVSHSENIHSLNTLSFGNLFRFACEIIKSKEPGAVMGMSSYVKEKQKVEVFDTNGLLYKVRQPFLLAMLKGQLDKFCFTKAIQDECTNLVKNKIKYILNIDKEANICLSGGFFQNCQINYEILNEHKKIFVDPLANDGGTSLGAALLVAYRNNIKIEPYKNLYLGKQPIYNFNTNFINEHKISSEQVAKLLFDNNLVALFQGRAEAGPRALGNRSLLFNPCNPHGKELVNVFKKREWYRPYAGTILHEHHKEWFDLNGKEEVPFMSYATKVLKNKQSIIPAITHVDGSCRIQTLKKEQNENFYNLISEFYKISNVPILLNTSLNIAGKPLTNSFEQLIAMFNTTNLHYIYIPEHKVLIKK